MTSEKLRSKSNINYLLNLSGLRIKHRKLEDVHHEKVSILVRAMYLGNSPNFGRRDTSLMCVSQD